MPRPLDRLRLPRLSAALRVLAALGVAACAPPARVVDWCVDNPGACSPCEGDDDCIYQGNPCTDVVYCATTDAPLAVEQIGCSPAVERSWPEPSTCGCDAGVCRSEE